MAFIHTIPAADATGDVNSMYERQQCGWGFVPNYAKVFSHRPDVMALWANMLRGIRAPMDARRFELVTFAAAHALRSSYCSLAHAKALGDYFTPEQLRALADGEPGAGLTPAESAMMAYARKVVTCATDIGQADIDGLREQGFDDAEIFDIAAVAAARAFFAQLVESLGTQADVSFMQMDGALRRQLTVGRSVATHDLEYVSKPTGAA